MSCLDSTEATATPKTMRTLHPKTLCAVNYILYNRCGHDILRTAHELMEYLSIQNTETLLHHLVNHVNPERIFGTDAVDTTAAMELRRLSIQVRSTTFDTNTSNYQ